VPRNCSAESVTGLRIGREYKGWRVYRGFEVCEAVGYWECFKACSYCLFRDYVAWGPVVCQGKDRLAYVGRLIWWTELRLETASRPLSFGRQECLSKRVKEGRYKGFEDVSWLLRYFVYEPRWLFDALHIKSRNLRTRSSSNEPLVRVRFLIYGAY
jgi:hypothetical protein